MSLISSFPDASDLRFLYEEAEKTEQHETVTSRFWTALLTDMCHGTGLHMALKQSPDHNRLRIDLVLYRVQTRRVVPKLYVEFNKARHVYDPNALYVQQDRAQVVRYCQNMMAVHPERRIMFAMLCYGARATAWAVRPDGSTSRVHESVEWADPDAEDDNTLENFFAAVWGL